MQKRWIALIIIVLISMYVAYGVFQQTKKDIVINKNLYINQGGKEPVSLTEDEFKEKVAAKGLEDAKAAIASISGEDVKLCQSSFCDDFLTVFAYEYFPNKILEKFIIEDYLKNYFELDEKQAGEFEKFIQSEYDNKYFLPPKRNGIPRELGSLKIIEDNKNYYFMYVTNESESSQLFNIKNNTTDKVINVIGEAYPNNEKVIQKINQLRADKAEILKSFKLGFVYTIPKDTFVEQNKIKAFFYKFNNLTNKKEAEETGPTITNTKTLLSNKQHIERLNITLSALFIENFYYQIFEKKFILGELIEKPAEETGSGELIKDEKKEVN